MKVIKFIILSIFLFAPVARLLSQDVWNDGYIIKDDGTLLTGQILIDKKSDVSELCTFRRFDIAERVTYAPSELKAFAVYNGPYYESHPDGEIKRFYRCIIRGKVSLFSLGKKLFVTTGNNEFVPLDKDFSTILAGMFKDDPDTSVPDNLKLDEEAISPIVAQYNSNNGQKPLIFAEASSGGYYDELINKGEYRYQWGAIIGGSLSLYAVDKNYVMFEMTGFHPDLSAGVFLNYRITRNPASPELQIEALLRKTNLFSYIEEEGSYTTKTIRTFTTCGFTGVKLPVTIRFKTSGNKVSAFGNIGVAATVIPWSEFEVRTETEYNSGIVRIATEYPARIFKYEFAGLAGAGIQYTLTPKNRITMEIRAEYGRGIFDQDKLSVINQHSLTLGVHCSYSF